ncbi:MAG: hypothetical protein LBN29_12025 [Mediterranea sp.]|jgi:hypothetical protein|nr:hypothetical protein [Mediterranea sp.]
MIGLKVQINDEEPVVAVTESLVLILDYASYIESGHLYLGGTDRDYYRPKWIDQNLNLGDKISVKVVDTETTSPTLSAEAIDRLELMQDFEKLRKELIRKGAIQ